MDYSKYIPDFSVSRFWAKLSRYARKAGIKVVNMALVLYYVATDASTSARDKAIIYGALGYFILPVDVIPDAIPVVGFSDDLTALVGACTAVAANITPAIRAKARERLARWFPSATESQLALPLALPEHTDSDAD